MERGAFLRKPANSRAQLLAQIKSDPIVAKRYQRHFGMTEDQVNKYFSGMSASTLPAGGRYLVWHVDPNGVMETKWLMLKKGTKVFMDKTGRVALKMNCGNPMIDSTVAKRVIQEPVVDVQPPPVVVEETFVPTPPPVVEVVPPPAVIVPEVVAAAPPAPPVVAVAPPIVPAPAIVTAPRVSGGGFSPWPLLLLGGAFLGGGGGGGGGTPPPVPEPATLIALGVGAAAVIRKRRRK
jgi:hypothetical protein